MIPIRKTEQTKRIIGWMRRKITLSLDGYRSDQEREPNFGQGVSLSIDYDDCSAPSIGRVEQPILCPNPSVVCMALQNKELPPAPSRDVRKLPDLKRENPSFAAMLVKYINERFGGEAPKVYNTAKISRKTYSAIAGNELRPVSKAIAVQFALALKLSRIEADEFLKSAGYAFSPAILEDIIVCACIECNIYEITDVNELLASYNAKMFASYEADD